MIFLPHATQLHLVYQLERQLRMTYLKIIPMIAIWRKVGYYTFTSLTCSDIPKVEKCCKLFVPSPSVSRWDKA